MPRKSRWSVLLILLLIAGTCLAACGRADATAVTEPPTPQPAESTAFQSPLEQPTATSVATDTQLSPLSPPPNTPDPDRTPVAITMAEIGPDKEIITIQNVSSENQDISGWILFNLNTDAVFRFPENTILQPDETVQVYSAVAEREVPEGAFFWTEEKVWEALPADVLLLNRATRLMYWYVHPEEP